MSSHFNMPSSENKQTNNSSSSIYLMLTMQSYNAGSAHQYKAVFLFLHYQNSFSLSHLLLLISHYYLLNFINLVFHFLKVCLNLQHLENLR